MSGRRTRREGGGNLEIANPAIPRFPPPRLLLFFLRSDKNQTQAKVLPMSPVYCVTYVPVHSRPPSLRSGGPTEARQAKCRVKFCNLRTPSIPAIHPYLSPNHDRI